MAPRGQAGRAVCEAGPGSLPPSIMLDLGKTKGAAMSVPARLDEPDIFNQSPPYEDVDLYRSDQPLQDAVRANGAASEGVALSAFGRRWGSAEMLEQARLANENGPK